MKRFTLLFSVMALGVFAVPHLSHAQEECVNVETIVDEVEAALLAEARIKDKFVAAFTPVRQAEMHLARALSMTELAEGIDAQIQDLGNPGLTAAGMTEQFGSSEGAQQQISQKQAEGEALSLDAVAHLRNACRPLVEGVIHTAGFAKVIVEIKDQLQVELEGALAELEQKMKEFASANALRKARMKKDLDAVQVVVDQLRGEVEMAVAIAEALPNYIETFFGNFVTIAKIFSENGVDVPSDPTEFLPGG